MLYKSSWKVGKISKEWYCEARIHHPGIFAEAFHYPKEFCVHMEINCKATLQNGM
jgi:hypothetical protein